jgi:hypothetical protein
MWLLIVLVMLALAGQPAPAQFPEEIGVRARVRVVRPDSLRQPSGPPREQWLRGEVAALAADTLYLRLQGTAAPLPIRRAEIRRIDRSLGVPGRVESAFRGAVAWAVVGGLTYAALRRIDDRDRTWRRFGDDLGEGATIGAGVGFILGAVFPSERWRRVRLP